ncbi:unnamed protein product [Peniophora sp. CBMAI 1063]|nr:unnamed protein product [Peniophora sp. CBMAI 1063]
MGLTYPTLQEKIALQEQIIEFHERFMRKNARRLLAHDIIKSAPMPWKESIGDNALVDELPNWLTLDESARLDLAPRCLWQEMREVLDYHLSTQSNMSDEQLRLRVGAQAVILDAMIPALESKIEMERGKLAELTGGVATR